MAKISPYSKKRMELTASANVEITMTEHPYCCDEFAEKTNEEDSRSTLKQNDDGSWTAYFDHDNYEFGPMRFCPFCGTRVDAAPGLERVWFRGPVFHAGGSIARWRDLANDGAYEVDNDHKILRAGTNDGGEVPVIRKKPDTRPVIINGVEALLENGKTATVDDLEEWAVYSFVPETRTISMVASIGSKTREPTFVVQNIEEPDNPPRIEFKLVLKSRY